MDTHPFPARISIGYYEPAVGCQGDCDRMAPGYLAFTIPGRHNLSVFVPILPSSQFKRRWVSGKHDEGDAAS